MRLASEMKKSRYDLSNTFNDEDFFFSSPLSSRESSFISCFENLIKREENDERRSAWAFFKSQQPRLNA